MRLTIEKTIAIEEAQRAQFVVTVFGHLDDADRRLLSIYGAPALDRFLDPEEELAFFSNDGLAESFDNLRDAEDVIARFKATCDATNAYWRDSEQFRGTERYPPGAVPPTESAGFGTW